LITQINAQKETPWPEPRGKFHHQSISEINHLIMAYSERKTGLPDGVKVWAAGGLMVVEIDSEATLEQLKARGPMRETPVVHRLADGAQFWLYRVPPGGKIRETGFPPHVVEALAALAEERTTVLAEARNARAGR